MNIARERSELEAAGYHFECRTSCPNEGCGSTVEWWRRVPGPLQPFRLHPRTGMLYDHREECPGKREETTKSSVDAKPPVKVAEENSQRVLFK